MHGTSLFNAKKTPAWEESMIKISEPTTFYILFLVGHGEGTYRTSLDEQTKHAIIQHKEDLKQAEVCWTNLRKTEQKMCPPPWSKQTKICQFWTKVLSLTRMEFLLPNLPPNKNPSICCFLDLPKIV